MGAQKKTANDLIDRGAAANEVHLIGRLSAAAQERTLPSEAVMATFLIVVDRLDAEARSRQRVDVINCVVWTTRLRRQVMGWAAGDVVEVSGALRKRFFRTGAGATGSRVEVEVGSARRVRRMAA
jgi:single-strand DNA-binding protein